MDCFLLCYSIEDRVTFNNLLSDWYPDIRDHAQSVPIVLVGEFYQRLKIELKPDLFGVAHLNFRYKK